MTQPQSKHWLDKLTDEILKWQEKTQVSYLHVDDMKTPSGRVHTGALRGVVLHDLVTKALADKTSKSIKNTYVFNDMDPMDGLPAYLDEKKWRKYMGMPLYKIPAPTLEESGLNLDLMTEAEKNDFKKAKNFAEFYAFDFIHAFRELGCSQEIIFSSQLYESGQMNQAIKLALDEVDEIKKIYQDVAEYNLPDNWHPFQVICPSCGKVGTTLTTNWNGREVEFECQVNKVDWAQGCGHKGKTSPLNGNGKLLWKTDWPAHWFTMGVNIEGAGKDHTSAGGSRDMANAMCQRVFKITIPFDIPYEWIVIKGAKMSSSKGIGASAREFVRILPPEVGRFMFVNKHYNQVLDFDPTTDFILKLFDEYDEAAKIYWKQTGGDQRLIYAFRYSQVDPAKLNKPIFLPRFRDVVIWMQHPEIDLEKKFAEVKGESLTQAEKDELKRRVSYAKNWLRLHAPTEYQFTPKLESSADLDQLDQAEKDFFKAVVKLLAEKNWQPEDLQQAIYELAKQSLGAKKGFQTIYKVMINKTHGPRAAWFLLAYQKIVQKRVKQMRL